MIREAIQKVIDKKPLTESEAMEAMDSIMEGRATPAQISALLVGLRMKGETVDEIAGFARSMRRKVLQVQTEAPMDALVDTCGTGGDHQNTFNISTAAAFVAAGGGLKIAKHGNRAMSSRCGSADILEALGINLHLPPEQLAECVDRVGIGFLFAQDLHPAMKYAAPIRRELGVRTVFNILGPLANPAGARCQVVGVFSGHLTNLMAEVLARLGGERAMVFHGLDGMDEITTRAETMVSELRAGEVQSYRISPAELGLDSPALSELAGGSPKENARKLESLLDGEKCALRDIVVLNAAAAMVVGGKAHNLAEGMEQAIDSIDSGAARHKLTRLKEFCRDT